MADYLPLVIIGLLFGIVLLLPTLTTRWVPALRHQRQLRGRAAWASARGLLPLDPGDAAGRIDDADRPGLFRKVASGRVLDAFQDHDVMVIDYAFVMPKPPGGRSVPMLEATSLVLNRVGVQLPEVQIQPWETRPPTPDVIARLTRPGWLLSDLMKKVYATTPTGDATFDGSFRVLGEDPDAVRSVLTPQVRSVMLRQPLLHYTFAPRGVFVRSRGILPQPALDQLIAVTRELVTTLQTEQRRA